MEKTKKKKFFTVKRMTLCALFTALIAVGAFIRVPIPVLPFTLQTLFVTLAGTMLGSRAGAISAAVYMLLGLAGVPIFTQGGGLGYLLKPSFGYIIGFCFGAYLAGLVCEKAKDGKLSYMRILSANFAGLGAVYLIGMAYFYIISNFVINSPIGFRVLVINCFLMTLPGDILLSFIGSFIALRLNPILKKYLDGVK